MRARRYRFKAMGGPASLQLEGDEAALERASAAAMAEVARLEQKYSRYRDDSLASRINASAGDPAGVELDPESAALIDYAARAFEQSGGLFDITSGILRRAWDFKSGRMPERGEVEALLGCVGFDKLEWRAPKLVLPLPGMQIDFGGYVKEYAADRAAEACRRTGVRHGLVELAGDIAIVGPHMDGAPWQIGIRDPFRRDRAIAQLPLYAGGLASSGSYERCMIVDGVRYGHILDPRTGWPIEEGIASVSVAAPQCLIAGTATTIALLKGAHDGSLWLDELGLPNLRVHEDGTLAGTYAAADERRRRGAEGPGLRAG